MLNREELAARLGVSVSTTYRWEADRDETGFPPPDDAGHWHCERTTTWHQDWIAAKRAKFRPVDRSGAPGELLDADQVGRVLGSQAANPGAVIRAYLSPRYGDYFPRPDELSSETGRAVPRWRRATIWAFADSREKHGGGKTGRSGRRPATTPPYANDPAMPAVRELLAANPNIAGRDIATHTGVSVAKAYRLINAAKAHPADTD
jgi:predicted DNA-binding transcriptional regulator AlpA